jgi:hypothetical protein
LQKKLLLNNNYIRESQIFQLFFLFKFFWFGGGEILRKIPQNFSSSSALFVDGNFE